MFDLEIRILRGDEQVPLNQIPAIEMQRLDRNVVGWPSIFALVDGRVQLWPKPEKQYNYDIKLAEGGFDGKG